MKLDEIVKSARAADKAAFGKVNDKRAIKILRAAFRQVNSQIESARDSNVAIAGLGRFAIRTIEREKDGVSVTKQRVIFHQRGAGEKRKAEAGQS